MLQSSSIDAVKGRLSLLIVTALIVAAVSYVIGIIVYRIFFHPLARYPGPFLAKITNLYGGYHAWTGNLHIDMLRCHEKYGEHVRYAPNRLIVSTQTGLKDIYAFTKDFRKSPAYTAMVHRAPNTLTIVDKKQHGRRRRIISQGFSDAALRGFEPTIMRHINALMGQFTDSLPSDKTAWGPPQNIARWSNYLTFDIMSDVIFGEEYNLVTDPQYRYVIEAIERSNVRTSVLIQAYELSFRRLDRYLFPDAIKGRNLFIQFVSKLLKERMSSVPLQRKDVFSFLLGAKDPETGAQLGMAEIGAEATTMIVAGSDTSSTAIAGVFFYLTRYPESYERVLKEVRGVFKDASEVTLGPALNSCVYLRACIDESLRLSPPAASSLWREVCSDTPVVIDGVALPKGTEVGVCIHAIHHNPTYYPDPYTFKPDRWITTDESDDAKADPKVKFACEQVQKARSVFNPFSVGPRSCIGKGLANVELMLALATVISLFDFKAADGAEGKIGGGSKELGVGRERENEYQMYDHVTAAKNGPMVVFRKRTDI